MTAAAQAMAEGDYTRRVTASSHDEVGRLADAFNTMAEDLEQVDLLRRELVANVSHELRTPLAALQAQLENLVDGVSPADPETLGAALHQTERLGRLVTDLLDLSRLEAGAGGLELAPVRLQGLFDDVVEAAALIAPAKDLTFVVDVRAGRADRAGRRQAPGPGGHQPRPERRAALPARRRGAARRPPRRARGGARRAWTRARGSPGRTARGSSSASREATSRPSPGQISTGGTGLGLAIVRWAVQLHGGSIEVVDSETGLRHAGPAPRTGHGGRAHLLGWVAVSPPDGVLQIEHLVKTFGPVRAVDDL